MANNSVTISVDSITFTWPTRRTLRAYLVGISVDSDGKVHVVESPASTVIKYRPKKGFVWDFAGSGFFIYQRTGSLPALVSYFVLLVRDRRTARHVGDMMQRLGNNGDFKTLVEKASSLAGTAGVAGAAVSTVGAITQPLLRLIGDQLAEAKDKLLDTYTGSQIFDAEALAKSTIEVPLTQSFSKIEFDVHLFDSEVDSDSAAAINSSLADLGKRGLTVGSSSSAPAPTPTPVKTDASTKT